MTWVKYTLPAAAIASIASPAYAMQYLSIEEAQKQAFPSATHFSEVQPGRVWKADAGGRVAGFFILDRVVGKHLYIDYAVALTPGGAVHSVEILQYRESYGGEIRSPSWLAQFVGKTSGRAQDQRRHQEHRRRDPVVDARHRRCEAGTGSLWQSPPIKFAARDLCSAPSLRSRWLAPPNPAWLPPSMRHSRRWRASTP
jgi:hypothetical protein